MIQRSKCVGLVSVLITLYVLMAPAATVVARSPATHAAVPVVSIAAEAGFSGYSKRMGWFPVRVTLMSTETIDGELLLDDGQADGDRLSTTITLARGARRTTVLYGRARNANYTVRLMVNGAELANQSVSVRVLADEDRLVVISSDPGDGFNFLGDLRTPSGGKTYIAQMPVAQLPDRLASMSSVDTWIVNNVDTALLSESQKQTVRAWVVTGGQFIVSGGPGGRLTVNGIPDLAPARILNVNDTAANVLDGLLTFANSVRPVNLTPISTTGTVPLAGLQLTTNDAQVLVGSPDTPLIVRRRVGRGLVDQLAFDAALAPLRDWPDRASAFSALFDGRVSIPMNVGFMHGEQSATVAARSLPAAALPSFLLVALFLLAYVLTIGPVNYLVLKQLNRYSWAWLTIPVCTVVFTGVGLIIGFGLRGSGPQLHRLSVAFGDVSLTDGAAQSVIGLFSPRRQTLDLDIGHALPDSVRENPGPTTPALPLRLREAEPNVIRDVTVNSSVTRAFYAFGETTLPKIAAELKISFTHAISEGPRIEGVITNVGGARLSDCVLLANGDQQVFAQSFSPGDKLTVGLQLKERRNRAILYPASDRLPQNGFSGRGSTFIGSSSLRVGKLYASGSNLMDALISWRVFPAQRLNDRDRELLSTALGDVRAQIGSGLTFACWEDAEHANVRTAGAALTDRGLRIWNVPVQPALASQGQSLAPDIYNWNVAYSASSISAGLTDMRVDSGSHIFSFSPWLPVRLSSSQARVNVRFEFGSATPRTALRNSTVFFYDWSKREFVKARALVGATIDEVSASGAIVSPTGEVRMMFSTPSEVVVEMQDMVLGVIVQ